MATLRPDSPSSVPRRPFVGRRAELAVLRTHLGRGRLIVVTGEPGIGKTRLAEEFAAEAEGAGAVVHWGRCWEGDGAPAFWPWIQIARDHARSSDDPSVRTAMERALGDLQGRIQETVTPPALDPAPARFRLFDTITTLLVTAAAARPLVLILEDLHWADRPSLVLLQFLVRHARTAPVLVVATYEESVSPAGGAGIVPTVARSVIPAPKTRRSLYALRNTRAGAPRNDPRPTRRRILRNTISDPGSRRADARARPEVMDAAGGRTGDGSGERQLAYCAGHRGCGGFYALGTRNRATVGAIPGPSACGHLSSSLRLARSCLPAESELGYIRPLPPSGHPRGAS